jgi:hypothetical protein
MPGRVRANFCDARRVHLSAIRLGFCLRLHRCRAGARDSSADQTQGEITMMTFVTVYLHVGMVLCIGMVILAAWAER